MGRTSLGFALITIAAGFFAIVAHYMGIESTEQFGVGVVTVGFVWLVLGIYFSFKRRAKHLKEALS